MGATTNEGVGLGAVASYSTQYIEKQIEILEENISESSNGSYAILNDSNNNTTLGTGPSLYLAQLGFSDQVSVNLPDPAAMLGRQLTFYGTFIDSESFLSINGSMAGSSNSYTLTSNSIAWFVSDGTTWWGS